MTLTFRIVAYIQTARNSCVQYECGNVTEFGTPRRKHGYQPGIAFDQIDSKLDTTVLTAEITTRHRYD